LSTPFLFHKKTYERSSKLPKIIIKHRILTSKHNFNINIVKNQPSICTHRENENLVSQIPVVALGVVKVTTKNRQKQLLPVCQHHRFADF